MVHALALCCSALIILICFTNASPHKHALKLPGSLRNLLIAGHRGGIPATPENSITAAKRAVYVDAPAIELDVVLSKDGVLFCQHGPALSRTTNIMQIAEFASRKRTVAYDVLGTHADWWTFDFTADELMTLERICIKCEDMGNPSRLESLESMLEAIQEAKRRTENNPVLLLELKNTDIFNKELSNLPGFTRMEHVVLSTLKKAQVRSVDAYLLSFEETVLRSLRQSMSAAKHYSLVQLLKGKAFMAHDTGVKYVDMVTKNGLDVIRGYADAIGPHFSYLSGNIQEILGAPWTAYAHSVGLEILVWSFDRRIEPLRLAFDFGADIVVSDDLQFALGAASTFVGDRTMLRQPQQTVFVDHRSLTTYENEVHSRQRREQLITTVHGFATRNKLLLLTGVICLCLSALLLSKHYYRARSLTVFRN